MEFGLGLRVRLGHGRVKVWFLGLVAFIEDLFLAFEGGFDSVLDSL